MAVRFVRLALKVVMQNDGDVLEVILLYTWTSLEYIMFYCRISRVTKIKKYNVKDGERGIESLSTGQ